jgi:hypothetical protein
MHILKHVAGKVETNTWRYALCALHILCHSHFTRGGTQSVRYISCATAILHVEVRSLCTTYPVPQPFYTWRYAVCALHILCHSHFTRGGTQSVHYISCSQSPLLWMHDTSWRTVVPRLLLHREFSLCFNGALSTVQVVGERRRYMGFGRRTERMWKQAVFKLLRHFTWSK